MTRRKLIIRVTVFLLLGAIVNVAVAWGCVQMRMGIGATYVPGGIVVRDAQGNITAVGHTYHLQSLGFPFRSFEASHEPTRHIRPLWPGFAINTIFYAAVLWVLFLIPGSVKRHRRRRRGQCIHCGYDLRGQPTDSQNCPECGGLHSLSRRERAGVRGDSDLMTR